MRPERSRRDALSLGQAGQCERGGPGLDEYQLGDLLRLRSWSRHGTAEPEPVERRGRSADHGDDDARDPGPHERGHQGPKSKPAHTTPLPYLVALPSWTLAKRFVANPPHRFQVRRHSRRDALLGQHRPNEVCTHDQERSRHDACSTVEFRSANMFVRSVVWNQSKCPVAARACRSNRSGVNLQEDIPAVCAVSHTTLRAGA